MEKKINPVVNFFENFIIISIILVLVQTFFEDFAIYAGFPVLLSDRIKVSAVIFDLIFTLEFLTRMTAAVIKRRGIHYFFYNNGWVDLISSVPLLLLVSGPEFLYQIFHLNIMEYSVINSLGVIKVIKAIRVARILRLLRVLKIFGKIKNTESVMAQRHVTTVSTITISTIIFFLLANSMLQEAGYLPNPHTRLIQTEENMNRFFIRIFGLSDENTLVNILKYSPKYLEDVVNIKYQNEFIYQSGKMKDANTQYHLKRSRDLTDEFVKTYELITPNRLLITYSRENYYKDEAFMHLYNFGLIILLLLVFMLVYTRHFVLSVSDPIFVMRLGFEKRDYTLAVKILKHYKDDEVFILADDFNSRWLPAKVRKISQSGNVTNSKLSMADVFKKS